MMEKLSQGSYCDFMRHLEGMRQLGYVRYCPKKRQGFDKFYHDHNWVFNFIKSLLKKDMENLVKWENITFS